MDVAVNARDLSVAYGSVPALDRISVSIPAGTATAVIGPNGSGKSTLLRAIAGLTRPTGGTLDVPAGDTPAGIAVVLQTPELDRSLPLSVIEAIRMARYPQLGTIRRLRAADHAAVQSAMERLDLVGLKRRQLGELSGGQRQRVLVAQGLAQESDLLLFDEPFTGVDISSRDRINAVFDDECGAGRSVMVSTHDLADARRCDLVILLSTRLVGFGRPDEVLRESVLREIYGTRLIRLGDDSVLLDDPHHDHDHDHD